MGRCFLVRSRTQTGIVFGSRLATSRHLPVVYGCPPSKLTVDSLGAWHYLHLESAKPVLKTDLIPLRTGNYQLVFQCTIHDLTGNLGMNVGNSNYKDLFYQVNRRPAICIKYYLILANFRG